MDSPSRVFYGLMLVGGVATVIFMLAQLHATFKRGAINRRAPFQPFTKDGNPIAFWGFIAWNGIATVGIVWGLVVIASRLLGQ